MNTNCLENRRCPKCGHPDEVIIEARLWVSLQDDGSDPYADSIPNTDVSYDEDSPAHCPECGHDDCFSEWLEEDK